MYGKDGRLKCGMIEFIYDFVRNSGDSVSEAEIIKAVLNNFCWFEYSKWQIKMTVLSKLRFLCDVGLLSLIIVKRGKVKSYRYYSVGDVIVDKFPRIRLKCKLGALFYGGRMGEGFLYPLFRYENFSIGCNDEFDIYVEYDGLSAYECCKIFTNKVREELLKLYGIGEVDESSN